MAFPRVLTDVVAAAAPRAEGDDARNFARLVGGKARALADLTALAMPVPGWLCVTSPVFETLRATLMAEFGGELESFDARQRSAVRDLAARIARRADAIGLSEGDLRALEEKVGARFPGASRLAVRSSAVGEDSASDSFAGQLDSFLFVPRGEIATRVLHCFVSAFGERALVYRRLRGLSPREVSAAVIVQDMVASRASGVLFTANPTTGDRTEAVLSAGLGLGEGIVGGAVETDTFLASLEDGAIRTSNVSEKISSVVESAAGGTHTETIDGARSKAPAISPSQVRDLVALGRRLQAHFGTPQDIEWALDAEERLHILQARPITTLERESIFDCSNIVESYPGISLPLTFSFVRHAYELTFREATRRLGVSQEVLDANQSIHSCLVALIDGRIYYNILNWYRIYALLPGFERALPAWEKALGLQKRFTPPQAALTRAQSLALTPLRVRAAGNLVVRYLSLDRDIAEYLAALKDVQTAFRSRDLASLEAHDLVELYEAISHKLLRQYAVSILNDLYAQQLYEALSKLIAKWDVGDPMALRNELLCGERGMESVEPVRSLLAIADDVRADAALSARFASDASDHAVYLEIMGREDLDALRSKIAQHVSSYGDRTLHELKLEAPLIEDQPEFLVAMLRNYVRGGQTAGAMETKEQRIREAAESHVRERLRGHVVRRELFDRVLTGSRKTIKNRENLRLARTRAYGMVKRIFRAIGRLLHKQGFIDGALDVFYLTTDETFGVIRGMAVTRDLRALVELRKREYASYAERQIGPRVVTRGTVYRTAFAPDDESVAEPTGEELSGIGCSPGRIIASAKVILDPSSNLDIRGEILIAPMTDPAWVFLMVAAGGLVAERGSILSHTAIIGRELGIPTVVGVKNATRLIASGQKLAIDGARGTVRFVT